MAIAISSCFNGCAIDKFGFSLCEQVNLRVVCCISIRRTKSVPMCNLQIFTCVVRTRKHGIEIVMMGI